MVNDSIEFILLNKDDLKIPYFYLIDLTFHEPFNQYIFYSYVTKDFGFPYIIVFLVEWSKVVLV